MRHLIFIALVMGLATAFAQDRVPEKLDTNHNIVMPDGKAIVKQRAIIKKDIQGMPETPLKLPNLDNLPFKKDPSAIADLFDKAESGKMPAELKQKENHLMVFVSASIPQGSLERIIRDSEKYGASLVLNGFINNSMIDTKAYVMRMGGYKWEINPKAYEHFEIKKVPTTVVYDGDKWIGIPGDVSMKYALDKLSAEPGWSEIIEKMKSS